MSATPAGAPRVEPEWPVHSRLSYALWRKSYTGGLAARARAFWHHVVRGYGLETCGNCGRQVEAAWLADSDLWREIMGHDGGLLCIRCFDGELARRGRFARWIPNIGEDAARPQGRAAQGSN